MSRFPLLSRRKIIRYLEERLSTAEDRAWYKEECKSEGDEAGYIKMELWDECIRDTIRGIKQL